MGAPPGAPGGIIHNRTFASRSDRFPSISDDTDDADHLHGFDFLEETITPHLEIEDLPNGHEPRRQFHDGRPTDRPTHLGAPDENERPFRIDEYSWRGCTVSEIDASEDRVASGRLMPSSRGHVIAGGRWIWQARGIG